ncbi:MAG: metallophosphoesterase, partial [Candidatus Neomarinimicrobiota bacterium]
RLAEQAVWLDSLLARNPNRWTIVAFHHPLYSMGHIRDDRQTRDAFLPIFDKYQVDLVLSGHDHVYSRTYPLRAGKIAAKKQKGTVYVISVSCPKAYDIGKINAGLMAKTGTQAQLFQVISVEPNRLEYKSYTADGRLFDDFKLKK